MRVAIIGAGFGGLAAGYKLAKSGINVTIFEREEQPGGLAVGFKKPNWQWSLEKHYHHWFTSDWSVRNLAKEIEHKVIFSRTKTSTFIDGKIYQLDSPLSLLQFDKLSFFSRLRTACVLAYLRFTFFWRPLELVTAEEFLKKYNGEREWEILWRPLFEKKFSNYYNKIPASWFWARIKKRSASLGYPEGGFEYFAKTLAQKISKLNGRIFYKTSVEKIYKNNNKIIVETPKDNFAFHRVICTLPSPIFVKITQGLPENYKANLMSLRGIGALNLILSLNKQFLTDGSYWLNINARHFPFVAIVEHTNFIDKKYYNGEHLIYVGNYLPHEHEYFKKDAINLLREFYPFLKAVNPRLDKSWINDIYLFKVPFAQPVIPLNYSRVMPDFRTPLEGVYLCNIQQVYPWDRGTNYAAENGERVADLILRGG